MVLITTEIVVIVAIAEHELAGPLAARERGRHAHYTGERESFVMFAFIELVDISGGSRM